MITENKLLRNNHKNIYKRKILCYHNYDKN